MPFTFQWKLCTFINNTIASACKCFKTSNVFTKSPFFKIVLGFYFHKNLDRYPTPKELMKNCFDLIFVKY
ncbi:hypothetical protein F7190_00095 [Helicobacter pylori]|nr:hypothetical protein [Helicobacter pylori]